jgi:hypothetical protein
MTLEYVFAGHSVQLALPAIAYLPATQSPHATDALAPAVAKDFPAAHPVQLALPAIAYEPAAHAVHTALPAIAYEPAAQGVHVPTLLFK